ncbi:MAG: aldo/keto reductase [Spirochaetales bacterium]
MSLKRSPLGKTGLLFPPIVFGSSYLGNLYRVLSREEKRAIVDSWFQCVDPPVAIDTANKYGAGLALESIGSLLKERGVSPSDVIISNKLGWARRPLRGPEPTFEPGVWAGLNHDAEQVIGYEGMWECWEQSLDLLNGYTPALLAVHDPDEYLAAASSESDRARRWEHLLQAFEALAEMKKKGLIRGVGVGAKDYRVIAEIDAAVPLDWAMFACSYTLFFHPPEVVRLMERMANKGIGIINSAIFHGGFLTGGDYFDYRRLSRDNPEDARLYSWRDRFFELCNRYEVSPAAAATQYGFRGPGIVAIALNSSKPEKVKRNMDLLTESIPETFWEELKALEPCE